MGNGEEIRSEKATVMLTPSLQARLKAFASRHRWSLSTAIEVLIEKGISEDEREE